MKSQRFLILILAFASCTNLERQSTVPVPEPAKEETLRVIIPSDFRSLSGVDAYAAKYNLPKLRETTLPNDDLEIRMYVGSRFGSDLLVITRSSGEWKATHFPFSLCNGSDEMRASGEPLTSPKSGWVEAWKKLKAAGLLSLSGVKDAGWNDGYDYIVETNLNKTYVLYEYINPHKLKNSDGQQMVALGDVIAEEFGLKAFRRDFSCDH